MLAFINTFSATAAAVLAWCIGEGLIKGKPSMLGAASGAVAGLVAITPACGNVGLMGAFVIGFVAGFACLWGVNGLKKMLGADDSLDVFGVHGVGGIVGALLTGVFNSQALGGPGFVADWVTATVGVDTAIGAQVWIQLKAVLLTIVWSGVVSLIAYKIVDMTIGLRVSEEDEREGLDITVARRDRVPQLTVPVACGDSRAARAAALFLGPAGGGACVGARAPHMPRILAPPAARLAAGSGLPAMVPHLITALTGPINELEQRILESLPAIERWFRLEWMEHTPPFYTSVDLRNAGFKLAPVDTNLFPGGFNNLTTEMLPLAVQAAMAAIEKICPEAKNLLLIPEKHTRNSFYLMNVARLMEIFHQAGLNVRLGTLDDAITAPTEVPLPDGSALTVEPLVRTRNRLGLKDFDPCTILLNNDLSAGLPKILENLHEQYLLPPLHAGWAVRRKTNHFAAYEEVAKKFAKLLGMDPWLINPMFARCGEVNFSDGSGAECLMSNAETLLGKIRRKYKEYGIQEKPFIIVKADAGTYGMGIMTVRDPKDLADLNRARATR